MTYIEPEPLRESMHHHMLIRDVIIPKKQAVPVESGLIFQHLCRMLLNGTNFTFSPENCIALCDQIFPKKRGRLTLTLPIPHSVISSKHPYIHCLDDQAIDTLCAVVAMILSRSDKLSRTDAIWLHVDDILALCQKEKSNRSYMPRQRELICHHLYIFSQISISIYGKSCEDDRGYEQLHLHSPLLHCAPLLPEGSPVLEGMLLWKTSAIQIGEWFQMKPPFASLTAPFNRKIMKYHPLRDKYTKRIGRYLSLMFRVNRRKSGGIVVRRMSVLLEQAGISLETLHPERMYNMIEKAMVRLEKDGIIGRYWASIPDNQALTDMVEQRARGWWNIYTSWTWCIEPPANYETQLDSFGEIKLERGRNVCF